MDLSRMLPRQTALPSRSVLRMVEEMGHLGVWSKDLQTKSEYWSSGFPRLLGYENNGEPISFEHFIAHVHPDDRKRIADSAGNEFHALPSDLRIRIVQPSGIQRWIHLRSQALFSPEGRHNCFFWIAVDVTEQQQAVEVLMQQDRRLESLAETYKAAMFTASPDGEVIQIHHWRALGLPSGSGFSNKVWLEGVYAGDRERVERHWTTTMIEKKPTTIRHRRHSVIDDSLVDIVYFFKPMFDDRGEVSEWVGLCIRVDDVPNLYSDQAEVAGMHVRAARALLDWSIEKLADESGVSVSTIRRLESDTAFAPRANTWQQIKEVLKAKGIEFSNSKSGTVVVGLRGRDPDARD